MHWVINPQSTAVVSGFRTRHDGFSFPDLWQFKLGFARITPSSKG
ncbi:hypothetical protein [Spirosoma terrae]